MSQKSIDGLKRRSPKQEVFVTQVRERKVATRSLKKPAKALVVRDELEEKNEKYAQDLKDFFEDVKDTDPTKLVELDEDGGEPKKKPKKRRLRKFLVIFGIFFALVAGVLTWVYIQGNDLVARITGGGNLWDLITADPGVPLETDPASGRTNVLIFGTSGYDMDNTNHDGGWLTDTLMVASLDQASGEIKTISLPRDLKVKTCTATGKINELYYCEYSKNDGSAESRIRQEKLGAEKLKAEIENILNIKIQYYTHVNWQALVQIVDAIGGIDVAFVYEGTEWGGEEVVIETTDKRGLADIYDGKCKCYLVKYDADKAYHLNGVEALGVARARNDWGGWGASRGNFSREQFQQKILQAVMAKAKKTNFAGDFMATLKVKDAVGDNLRMNFKDKEFKTLFGLADKIDLEKMEAIPIMKNEEDKALMLDGYLNARTNERCDTPGKNYCYSYVWPALGVGRYTNIQKYVKKQLSGEADMEAATLSVMNATTTSGLASKEKVKLENLGFEVTQAVNAPKNLKANAKITIYKLGTEDFPKTISKLKDLYGDVKIKTDIPESLQNVKSDFVIIIGA